MRTDLDDEMKNSFRVKLAGKVFRGFVVGEFNFKEILVGESHKSLFISFLVTATHAVLKPGKNPSLSSDNGMKLPWKRGTLEWNYFEALARSVIIETMTKFSTRTKKF